MVPMVMDPDLHCLVPTERASYRVLATSLSISQALNLDSGSLDRGALDIRRHVHVFLTTITIHIFVMW